MNKLIIFSAILALLGFFAAGKVFGQTVSPTPTGTTPTVTPTTTPTNTPTVTSTPTPTRTVTPTPTVVIPQGAPVTGLGGS